MTEALGTRRGTACDGDANGQGDPGIRVSLCIRAALAVAHARCVAEALGCRCTARCARYGMVDTSASTGCPCSNLGWCAQAVAEMCFAARSSRPCPTRRPGPLGFIADTADSDPDPDPESRWPGREDATGHRQAGRIVLYGWFIV